MAFPATDLSLCLEPENHPMSYHGPEIELGEAKNRFWANSRQAFPYRIIEELPVAREIREES
jgi:hypothetical protein